jgi:hypothetical protein
MIRNLVVLMLSAVMLSACANGNDLDEPPVPLGRFVLGHNIVVAPELVKGPLSREADPEDFIAEMQKAIDARFGRYDGDKIINMAVSLEGYVLAQPGVPIVFSPKSIIIIRVTLWDDARGVKLNQEPEQITVFESFSADTLIGSGLTQSKEKQMRILTENAAKAIQTWMLKNPEWFEADPALAAAAVAEAEAEAAAEAAAIKAAEEQSAREAAAAAN